MNGLKMAGRPLTPDEARIYREEIWARREGQIPNRSSTSGDGGGNNNKGPCCCVAIAFIGSLGFLAAKYLSPFIDLTINQGITI